MRRVLVAITLAACGGGAASPDAAPDAPDVIALAFHDLGAPPVVASLTFDASGAPVASAAAASAGPYAVARFDGSAWTPATGVTTTSRVALLAGGNSGSAGALTAVTGDGSGGFDMWQLADATAFAWQQVPVPTPDTPGPWGIVGEDGSSTLYALVEGAGLTMATWTGSAGAPWVDVPGFDEAGAQQGVIVAPDGATYIEFSPPDTEDFTYQRVGGGATSALSPCTAGAPSVFVLDGSFDAASDVYFEDCDGGELYEIAGGGTCYAPVIALPAGVCGLVQTTADGTVFVWPTQHGLATAYRLQSGATAWDTLGGEVDGGDGYVARDAHAIFRVGNAAVGIAEADL
nr:hypothetical protein [Kofleriaceae bacterium]